MRKPKKLWSPSLWAGWKPFGIGERRPNNYLEIIRAAWENRDQGAYAWRILRRGVCDGCALGTRGLRDWTLGGVHLCNVRLRLLRLNTMPALDPAVLADAEPLRSRTSAELRALGRLPQPLLRRRGRPGFEPLSWDDALDLIATSIRGTRPERLAFYLTSRGMPNESYYVAQKSVRALGTNSIDNAARVCHSPSTSALKSSIGVAASTCSYRDWIGTDLVVFIGSNVANNQPVATKYLHYAKKAGTKVAVVNTYREPGMERYWVPSVMESALFGTRIADRFFMLAPGGDAAFLSGALKEVVNKGWLDRAFVESHTTGLRETAAHLAGLTWEQLEQAAGAPRAEMKELARMLSEADSAVLVWSMGITQHVNGEDNVRAIINLALARGFVGREGCGLMPIRGHSGVQGGSEMGAYATAFPGGLPVDADNAARLSRLWGFEVPVAPGLSAPEMIDAAGRAEIDVLFSAGGNFLEVLPDPPTVEAALGRVRLRVHMDLVLSSQMLAEPGEAVLLLPATTRYESPGGITETSTERRVIFSPEIRGPRSGQARSEWQVLGELAARVRPELAGALRFESADAIRTEIAAVIPSYEGIQRLRRAGDQFQYGGRLLCEGGIFPTPDGRGRFQAVKVLEAGRSALPEGALRLTTRRGKQFNSMVQGQSDPLNGAARDAVLLSREDAKSLGLKAGDRVELTSPSGRYEARVQVAPVAPGSAQVHWPEGNVLIDPSRRSPLAGIPDYGAVVTVTRLAHSRGRPL